MENKLHIYNTLTRKKEKFEPLNPPFVGLYVCGPTVYGDAHLGNARPVLTFDVLFRYLLHIGFKVRYVRNITDVGHLSTDFGEGEDKIAKKAKIEQLEPMEVVQKYINSYHKNMEQLNTLNPSIEPQASGHIIEQAELIKRIMEKGYAYEVDGSVYFDVVKYSQNYNYGELSGRVVEDLMTNTRNLDGQSVKRNPADFALWKKAMPEHIMRWPSDWSEGYPGWHLECSVMSTKYLGDKFDIHGGGLDLQFPHHECEIAQTKAARGEDAVKYWMHNNMITLEGNKMSKSLGNLISLNDMFSGEHELLDKAYRPEVVRFFMLQAHYRNPLDFSNKALIAAEKGLDRLMSGIALLDSLKPSDRSSFEVSKIKEACYDALNDDLNTPILIANLFDGIKKINSVNDNTESINKKDLAELKNLYHTMVFELLGVKMQDKKEEGTGKLDEVMDLLLNLRMDAKANKDFDTSDKIRDKLNELGIIVKDKKDGFDWGAQINHINIA